MALPFRVTLLRFRSEKYPGSNMPATYESFVRVDDPQRGTSEHHISMNNPLHYRGYIFFQSSFVEGQPMMSIFSVARAPGLPLVYLGVTLIGVGVAWMFYIKPYLVKRKAALAAAAPNGSFRMKQVRLASILVLLAAQSLLAAGPELEPLRTLAIQDGGRLKPLDSFARAAARRVSGAKPFTGESPSSGSTRSNGCCRCSPLRTAGAPRRSSR